MPTCRPVKSKGFLDIPPSGCLPRAGKRTEFLSLALDKLVPVYQPIVRLGEGERGEKGEKGEDERYKVVGYEILSRFPSGGYRGAGSGISLENPVIDPDTFYRRVWNAGLGVRSKRTLFDRVTRDMSSLGKSSVRSLWFNITMAGLYCPTVHDLVRDFRFNFPSISVGVEVHESDRLEEKEIAILKTLRERGVKVALDDWGSPESDRVRGKLNLGSLDIDAVKLDKVLLVNPARLKREVERLRKKGVRAIVAEGVESDRDLGLIRSLGIEMGQGYYFGRPGREIIEAIDR